MHQDNTPENPIECPSCCKLPSVLEEMTNFALKCLFLSGRPVVSCNGCWVIAGRSVINCSSEWIETINTNTFENTIPNNVITSYYCC